MHAIAPRGNVLTARVIAEQTVSSASRKSRRTQAEKRIAIGNYTDVHVSASVFPMIRWLGRRKPPLLLPSSVVAETGRGGGQLGGLGPLHGPMAAPEHPHRVVRSGLVRNARPLPAVAEPARRLRPHPLPARLHPPGDLRRRAVLLACRGRLADRIGIHRGLAASTSHRLGGYPPPRLRHYLFGSWSWPASAGRGRSRPRRAIVDVFPIRGEHAMGIKRSGSRWAAWPGAWPCPAIAAALGLRAPAISTCGWSWRCRGLRLAATRRPETRRCPPGTWSRSRRRPASGGGLGAPRSSCSSRPGSSSGWCRRRC